MCRWHLRGLQQERVDEVARAAPPWAGLPVVVRGVVGSPGSTRGCLEVADQQWVAPTQAGCISVSVIAFTTCRLGEP